MFPLLPLAGEGGAERRMRVSFVKSVKSCKERAPVEPTPSSGLSATFSRKREKGKCMSRFACLNSISD